MSNLILSNAGKPFMTEKVANIQKVRYANKGRLTKVVEIEGGFALEVLSQDEIEQAIPEVQAAPERTNTDAPKRTRKKKPGVLGTINVLKYPDRPGYVRRVFNDEKDAIFQAQERDWVVVNQADLTGRDPVTGRATQMGLSTRRPVGGGISGVLMEKPKEWYDEDYQEEQDLILANEKNTVGVKQELVTDGIYGLIS